VTLCVGQSLTSMARGAATTRSHCLLLLPQREFPELVRGPEFEFDVERYETGETLKSRDATNHLVRTDCPCAGFGGPECGSLIGLTSIRRASQRDKQNSQQSGPRFTESHCESILSRKYHHFQPPVRGLTQARKRRESPEIAVGALPSPSYRWQITKQTRTCFHR